MMLKGSMTLLVASQPFSIGVSGLTWGPSSKRRYQLMKGTGQGRFLQSFLDIWGGLWGLGASGSWGACGVGAVAGADGDCWTGVSVVNGLSELETSLESGAAMAKSSEDAGAEPCSEAWANAGALQPAARAAMRSLARQKRVTGCDCSVRNGCPCPTCLVQHVRSSDAESIRRRISEKGRPDVQSRGRLRIDRDGTSRCFRPFLPLTGCESGPHTEREEFAR